MTTEHTEPKMGNLQVKNCDFRGYNMDGTDPIQYTRNYAGEIIRVDFTMDGWLCFGPTITRETEPDVLHKLAEAYGNQRTTADEERQALMDALQSQAVRIKSQDAIDTSMAARITELEAEVAATKQQAQIWKMEADTQKATVHEIYQLCTGATGGPGDWNGANPVREVVTERDILQGQLTMRSVELSALRQAIKDKGGDEHSPTQWAYDQACAALSNHKAQLATLQSDDELPELPVGTLIGEARDGIMRHKVWFSPEALQAYARQAQSMVRAKMVPLEKDAARYRILRDDKYQHHEDDICVADSYFVSYFGEELDAAVDALEARYIAIDAAMGITGEPK